MQAGYSDTALLFRRAGFGGTDAEIKAHQHRTWEELVSIVLDTNRAPGAGSRPDLSPSRDWYARWVDMLHYWLDRSRRPVDQAPIVEKMTLFWHGTLCSSLDKTANHKMMFDQNEIFRQLGMGDFATLIHAVSLDPAMLCYLDNDRNTVDRPNENFARELMELFTIGNGQFTQDDVVASTRAWTGHGLDDNDRYRFNPADHDQGTKTFMGQSGNLNGPTIINIILDRRRDAHARFMCHRLWSFFAYPVSPTDGVVTSIMAAYKPQLNIKATLRAIFLHPAFRSSASRNGLVRSPAEFVVAMMRHTRTDCSVARPEWFMTSMGQILFNPPNVSGWRQNDYWLTETAVWGKAAMASSVRYRVAKRDDLGDVNAIERYNPKVYKFTVEQAVDQALANYQLEPVSNRTRQVLINYLNAERANGQSWVERYVLLLLPLLAPELQMA